MRGGGAILALVFWGITKNPLTAVIFSIASDGFACIPTIVKSIKYPETEMPIAYIASLFSALTSFFALKTFSASEIAFPIYLVIANLFLVGAIYIGRMNKNYV